MTFSNIKNEETYRERSAIAAAKAALTKAIPASTRALYEHPTYGGVGVSLWQMIESIKMHYSKFTTNDITNAIAELQEGHSSGTFETFMQRQRITHSALDAAKASLTPAFKLVYLQTAASNSGEVYKAALSFYALSTPPEGRTFDGLAAVMKTALEESSEGQAMLASAPFKGSEFNKSRAAPTTCSTCLKSTEKSAGRVICKKHSLLIL